MYAFLARSVLCFVGLAVCDVPAAAAQIVVTGGADDLVQPDVAAAFKLVRSGQIFAAASVDSAAALLGFLNNDCTFDVLSNCSWSPLGPGSPVDLAVSLIPLSEAQITAYNTAIGASEGPLIQFPYFAAAVAIPIRNSKIVHNGQLILDDGALCGIMSGQITDWSQFSLNAAPGPFEIIYDSNPGSGATWLLTQHLNTVCDATNSTFTILPVPVTSDFASLPIIGGVTQNDRFVAAAGNAGMASALTAAGSAVGYIGPNYTSLHTHAPTQTKLVVASMINALNGQSYLPTVASITLAMANPGPSATNAVPPATLVQSRDPVRWVPEVPLPAAGYPIVGYANWVFSTCYLSLGPVILQFLTMPASPAGNAATLSNNGFVALATANPALSAAVAKTLLSNQSGFNLDIQNPVACPGR